MREKLENLKLIYEKESDYSYIRLYETEDDKLMLTLDTFVQFLEGEDEKNYHDALTRPAFEENKNAKDFLILGGGDGLVARNIFKLNNDANITIVDIDREVTSLGFLNKRLRELNEYSLFCCEIYNENAIHWVKRKRNRYDIIVCDLPDPNTERLENLYSEYFYKDVIKLLKDNGIISIQCHFDIVNKVVEYIQKLLGNSKRLKYEMPFLSGGEIILGRKT